MTKRMSEMAEEIACRPEISQGTAYEMLEVLKGIEGSGWQSYRAAELKGRRHADVVIARSAYEAIEAVIRKAERGE